MVTLRLAVQPVELTQINSANAAASNDVATLFAEAMRPKMKHRLIALAREVDAFCARINDGLTAAALLLGFLVMTMAVIRAQDISAPVFAATPMTFESSLGN